jgi:hypothetical protein
MPTDPLVQVGFRNAAGFSLGARASCPHVGSHAGRIGLPRRHWSEAWDALPGVSRVVLAENWMAMTNSREELSRVCAKYDTVGQEQVSRVFRIAVRSWVAPGKRLAVNGEASRC